MKKENIIEIRSIGKVIQLYLPNKEDHIQKIIRTTRNFYEIEMLEDIKGRTPPNSVIVDVGANIGNHSVFFGAHCEASQVYAFEPYREVFSILEMNIELNELESIICPSNIALGDSICRGKTVVKDSQNLGMAKIKESPNGDIQILTLDSVLIDKINRLDLMKIDVEGMEFAVLRGSENLLRKFSPLLYIEIADERDYSQIMNFLHILGYEKKGSFNATPTYLFQKIAQASRQKTKRTNYKIAFFAGDLDNFHFVQDIEGHFQSIGCETRLIKSNGMKANELSEHMSWSDTSWFEWANGPIIPASHL